MITFDPGYPRPKRRKKKPSSRARGRGVATDTRAPSSAPDVAAVLEARGRVYGDFRTQTEVAQSLKQTIRGSKGWWGLESDQREALEMICTKISRIMMGDPNHIDSWRDISGYAELVTARLAILEEHGEIP